MPTILITGANRGIGLELTRTFAKDGWRVHACCRDPGSADALRQVDGTVVVHRLDVTDDAMVAGLARELDGEALDILFNNAGVYAPPDRPIGSSCPPAVPIVQSIRDVLAKMPAGTPALPV